MSGLGRSIKIKTEDGESWRVWLRLAYQDSVTSQAQLQRMKTEDASRWRKGIDFMGRKCRASQRQPSEEMALAIERESLMHWMNREGLIMRAERAD